MRVRFIALAAPLLLALAPPTAPVERMWPEVADRLLLTASASNMGPQPPFNGLAVLNPRTATFELLLDGAHSPLPSPDGNDLVVVRGDAVVDLASDTLQRRWSTTLSGGPTVAFGHDRVYAAMTGHRRLTIVALDRVDGFERRQWDTELPPNVVTVDARVSADGSELTILGHPNSPGPKRLWRFRLPDGQPIGTPTTVNNDPSSLESWPQRPLANGRGLFGIAEALPSQPLRVSFLDFATGSVEQLELPLRANGRDWLPFEHGVSADGQHLYVFAPTLNQLTVVDLMQRRVEQTVALDASPIAASPLERALGMLGDLLVSTAEAKVLSLGTLQVAPDGQRIYAVGMRSRQNDLRMDGLIAIDTSSWQIRTRWLPGAEINRLLLSSDGTTLYIQEQPWATTRSAGVVHMLDVNTGVEFATTDALPQVELHSVRALFADAYGYLPLSQDPQPPPARPAVPPFTGHVSVERGLPGQLIELELRFASPDSSYVEPSEVTAQVSRAGSSDNAIDLSLERVAVGVYRATFALPAPVSGSDGAWSIYGVAAWDDGPRRRVELRDAVFVQPAFATTDGRQFVLDVTTDPPRPRPDEPARLHATFVDAESGAPLPDDVDLVDMLPDRLQLDFFGQGSTARVLQPVGRGVYEGEVRFWAAGDWRIWAVITRLTGISDTLQVGTLRVGDDGL